MQASGLMLGTRTYPSWAPLATRQRVCAVAYSPASVERRRKRSLPVDKVEVFKALDGWASERVLPLLKPVEKCWQPSDFLPDSACPSDEFLAQVTALQERTAEIPDDYLVVLVGNMITEDALPTYQTVVNSHEGIRDETGACQSAWARLTRAWAAEENRHGDLLQTYLYLTGRVDMPMIERTIQHLIGNGMDPRSENDPYMGYVYASFQERATFVTHGNTARMVKGFGDPVLARICGTIAADEKRHEKAYTKIMEKLVEVDPDGAVLAVASMMQKRMIMPGNLMYDGQDPGQHEHFSAVLQRLGVYTIADYADLVDHLIGQWRLDKLEGLSSEASGARDFVCGLAPKIRRLQERADECARKMAPNSVKFSWIFNREILL